MEAGRPFCLVNAAIADCAFRAPSFLPSSRASCLHMNRNYRQLQCDERREREELDKRERQGKNTRTTDGRCCGLLFNGVMRF